MTVQEFFETAQDIARAYADLVEEHVEPTVGRLLLELDRCPSCASPLVRGSRIAFCTSCGSQVEAYA